MVVDVSELDLVAEAGGIPQESPPHQAGEDRGRPREEGGRRDGGVQRPEENGSREEAARRVQSDEGRGQGTGAGQGTGTRQ